MLKVDQVAGNVQRRFTHPSINQGQRRVITFIKTKALLLSQTATVWQPIGSLVNLWYNKATNVTYTLYNSH